VRVVDAPVVVSTVIRSSRFWTTQPSVVLPGGLPHGSLLGLVGSDHAGTDPPGIALYVYRT
jgi:hypothetical protein